MTLDAAGVTTLIVVGAIGHVMAGFWFAASKLQFKITKTTIYDLPIKSPQLRREFLNSLHAPSHAVYLFAFLAIGSFSNRSWLSFFYSFLATFIWAEIWHYLSHRAMHLPALHWIHAEHHKSRLNSPLTAISFSFSEKLLFDLGLIGLLAGLDVCWSFNFFGICAWFIAYIVINSYSHANFEIKSPKYLDFVGKYLTSTTYHSLHHARYTGNYGLGTRFLDRLFGTEWPDYEPLYRRITEEKVPLAQIKEMVRASRDKQHQPIFEGRVRS